MNKLSIKRLPIGWSRISATDSEFIACMFGRGELYARMQVFDYMCDTEDLKEEIYEKMGVCGLIDSERCEFLQNNIQWNADYRVASSEHNKFRAFFYAILDKCYLLIELVTDSEIMHTRFLAEGKRLISSIDYSEIEHDSVLKTGNAFLRVQTPDSFRLSYLSTEKCLIFIGDRNYLFVGVKVDCELHEYISKVVRMNRLGTACGNLKMGEAGKDNTIQWASYQYWDGDVCIGKGTYFNCMVNGEEIVSFLFERGIGKIDVRSLLRIRGD